MKCLMDFKDIKFGLSFSRAFLQRVNDKLFFDKRDDSEFGEFVSFFISDPKQDCYYSQLLSGLFLEF